MLEGTLKWKEMTRTDRRQGCPPEHWVVLGITAPCQAMGAAGEVGGLHQARLLAVPELPKMILRKSTLGMGVGAVQLPEDFSHILQTPHWIPPHRLWKT